MGLTPLGCFCSKRRFENQKPTKTKKQAKFFRLLFDLFCTQDGNRTHTPERTGF